MTSPPITLEADKTGTRSSLAADLVLVVRQLRYEQLNFWRNRFAAVMTIGFSVIFMVFLGASDKHPAAIGGVAGIQYYASGFAAYGLMSACYNTLAIQLVNRRETGLLKRLRLAPIPTWSLLGAFFANAAVVSALQVAVLLVIARFAYALQLPHQWLALAAAFVVGVACFTALGVAVSTIVPSQDAAGPVISLTFFVLLFLSGLYFPLTPGSVLARISNFFPIHHLIVAFFAPFNTHPGASPWAWHDLLVVAIWGVVSTAVALRHFAWEPHRR